MISLNSFAAQYFLIFIFLNVILNVLRINWMITFLGWAITYFCLSWCITKFMRNQMDKEIVITKGKAVIITGCDSGFGHGIAKRLNSVGFTIFAACLNPSGSGPTELKNTCAFPEKMRIVELDVTMDNKVQKAKEEIEKSLQLNNEVLWGLINNAGIFGASFIEWGTLDTYKQIMEVNVLGLVRVTRNFLPLIRQSEGRIINIASVAGRYTASGLSAYSMSKHAVVSFSDALRREMNKWSVKVITIEPEAYRTPMSSEENVLRALENQWEDTNEKIKSDYGANYFFAFKEHVSRIIRRARPNTGEVFNAVFDAIISKEPEIRYKCGGTSMIIFLWIIEHFPIEITDKIMSLTSISVKPRILEND